MSTAARPLRRTVIFSVLGVLLLFTVLVLVARWLRFTEVGEAFITRFPGETPLPENAPVGFPAWLAWQHFLNAFFLVLIVRTGLKFRSAVRSGKRPEAFVISRAKEGQRPNRLSTDLWLHQAVDIFWFANGVLYVVLLFASGQWMRIVPTDWAVFPNALSAALQYLSLDWPQVNTWLNYNSLQQLAYFVTVFIAAPLAALSGVRLTTLWPQRFERLGAVFTEEHARKLHFPVMLYFVAFVAAHVTLVLTTGALRNLNHMFGVNDGTSWLGFGLFALSLVLMTLAWFAVQTRFIKPLASLFGEVK